MATPAEQAAAELFGEAIGRTAQQDAPAARWVTGARRQHELRQAARADTEAADLVVRTQLDAGMTPDQVEASAERVLAGSADRPTAVSDAFYDAYDQTAATYVAEARELLAGPGIEAG